MKISSLAAVSTLLVLCSQTAVSVARESARSCVHDADHPDRVKVIPGYPQGSPPSPLYSGYIEYDFEGEHMHTHYMLVTAETAFFENTTDIPLLYWSNGGPGASSMFGLWTELGPLLLNDLSHDSDSSSDSSIPVPQYNPFAWTRLGHVLIIDQPAPVGFSYCNNDTQSHNCGSIKWTDELTSAAAYQALQGIMTEKFPCLGEADLFLTGESYGGIYIPTLAREFVRHESKTLQGFAVGDGCLGTETDICGIIQADDDGENVPNFWDLLFLAGHGQIPMRTYRQVMDACRKQYQHHNNEVNGFMEYSLDGSTSSTVDSSDELCKEAWLKVERQVGGVYAYGLYDECTYENGLSSSFQGGLNDYPCGGVLVMQEYFALDAVKEAFHLPKDKEFFQTDNAEGDFDYTPTEPDLRDFYKQMNGLLRILVYNGDADPAINSFAAQNWTSRLGFEEEQEWRPWTVDGCRRMGGYVTRYGGSFDFLTIRGAGHMVPTIKAAAALTFMKAWINDEDYPVYDKDCANPSSLKRNNKADPLIAVSK